MVPRTISLLCFFLMMLLEADARVFDMHLFLACSNNNKIHDNTSALWMRAREKHSKQTARPSLSMIAAKDRKTMQEKTAVIMYHKPPNVVTSHSNADLISNKQAEQSRRTVYEEICSMKGFVSDYPRGKGSLDFETATNIQSKLHAIGRLDAATTGLLLLTNDGNLVHHITNPNAKQCSDQDKPVKKTYEALIMGHHEFPAANTTAYETCPLVTLMKKGVTLSPKHGGQTNPVDDITILKYPTTTTTLVSITISEGKNRQIRRMFHSVGSGVMKLHRVSIGNLTMSGLSMNPTAELKESEWRLLSDDEIMLGLGWKCRLIAAEPNDRRKQSTNYERHLSTRNVRRRKKR